MTNYDFERAEKNFNTTIEQAKIIGRQKATIAFANDIIKDLAADPATRDGLRMRANCWINTSGEDLE